MTFTQNYLHPPSSYYRMPLLPQWR